MSINKVIITGNLTRDPELRQTASGFPVLGFGVAVNDRRKDPQTGEWKDYPNYIDCTMFGTRAQSVAAYLSKGSKVAIEGKLRWSQWERDGVKRNKIEVIVDEIEFMSSRDGQGAPRMQQPAQPYQSQPYQSQPYQSQPYQSSPYGSAPAAPMPDTSVYDEDIPF